MRIKQDYPLLKVELPKLSLAKAKKAISFFLEDTLLDDIENLDFFVKKAINTLCYEVIVIDKQIINELQEKIAGTALIN
jgi:type II secretory pathway component PulL